MGDHKIKEEHAPLAAISGSNPAGETFFTDLVERFIEPEVLRRIEAGGWAEGRPITHFQVLLHEDRATEVRLNHEIGGSLLVEPVAPIGEHFIGQDVALGDIAGVSEYRPREGDAGIPHVTAFGHAGGWSLAFEFAGGHPSRFDFLTRAREFRQSAEDALRRAHLGSFLDNAYSATELLAKAELLAAKPTVELVLNSKKHHAISTPYHQWANLGNTDLRFAALLKHLHKLRGAGRYLDAPIEIDIVTARETLGVVKDMEEHVSSIVHGSPHVNGLPGYHVYATRELRAGELVRREDFRFSP